MVYHYNVQIEGTCLRHNNYPRAIPGAKLKYLFCAVCFVAIKSQNKTHDLRQVLPSQEMFKK